MTYCQKTVGLRTKGRGVYDVTSSVERIKEIGTIKIGLCHVFIKHTSASITLFKKHADDNMEQVPIAMLSSFLGIFHKVRLSDCPIVRTATV